MKVLLVLLVAAFCEARPSIDSNARPLEFQLGFGSFVVGGVEATPGEFPWQLSQQRNGAHSCGASLLSDRYALSAAHCVDGAAVAILRVVAGLHDRTAANGVASNLSGYKMHERYNQDPQTFSNDIAILTLSTPIGANGGSIQYATLPADNGNQYVGATCIISGWGRTSSSNTLPNNLQKANIQIISEAECNQRMAPVSGANVGGGQICLYDAGQAIGSCNGDSGGPLNCDRVVAGVTSWGISGSGACMQSYPSVYSRTSFYLQWIRDNTQ
jgi:secreted trypsin-like serine protease